MEEELINKILEEAKADSKSTTSEPADLKLVENWTPTSQWVEGAYPWRHRRLLQAEFTKTGVPWLHWEEPTTQKLLEASESLQEGDCLLVLLGPRGTGKTQAAVELSLKLDLHLQKADRPIGHMYAPLGELLNKEKASWDDKMIDSPLKKAKGVGLLVLDEIQESSASDWECQQLTLLIDDRYRNMKRTILIGNLNPTGLEKFLSKSIASRLKETGTIIQMTGEKYR